MSLTRARRQLKLREEGREMDGTHELLPDLLPPSLPRILSSTQGLPPSSRRCFHILECFPSAFSPASSVALLFVLARSRNLVSRTLPRPSLSPLDYPPTELLSPLSVALDNPPLWTPSPSKNSNRRPRWTRTVELPSRPIRGKQPLAEEAGATSAREGPSLNPFTTSQTSPLLLAQPTRSRVASLLDGWTLALGGMRLV